MVEKIACVANLLFGMTTKPCEKYEYFGIQFGEFKARFEVEIKIVASN